MKKKIILGVSLGLVVAIVISVITLACVQKSYQPEFDLTPKKLIVLEEATDDYYEAGVSLSTSQEQFEKIQELFEKSFKQSVLTSIFTGNISNDVKVNSNGTGELGVPSFKEGYTITFDYKAQMCLKENGEKITKGTYSEENVLFQTVMVNIVETEGFEKISLYALEEIGGKTYRHEITTIADTSELYDYLTELEYK